MTIPLKSVEERLKEITSHMPDGDAGLFRAGYVVGKQEADAELVDMVKAFRTLQIEGADPFTALGSELDALILKHDPNFFLRKYEERNE